MKLDIYQVSGNASAKIRSQLWHKKVSCDVSDKVCRQVVKKISDQVLHLFSRVKVSL